MNHPNPAPSEQRRPTFPEFASGVDEDDGYVGEPTDTTPNENYTVPGVLAGLPTPETEQGRCQVHQPCVDEDDWTSS